MVHRNKVTHSEEWWQMIAGPTDVRCEGHYKGNGLRCRREAIPGSTVCRQHGGAASQVRRVAAARIGNAADEMVKRLHAMLDDPAVEPRDKIKIAQDMLDRAGLNATEKLIVGVGEIDPVEALFRDLLADLSNLEQPVEHQTSPEFEAYNRAALEDDVVEAEWFEPAAEPEPEPDEHTVQVNGSLTPLPPPHIVRDLKRLGLL